MTPHGLLVHNCLAAQYSQPCPIYPIITHGSETSHLRTTPSREDPQRYPPHHTEKVKEFSRSINRLKRDFQREIYKLQATDRKLTLELERMVKKKEPASSKRIMAQNILRNQRYMRRYQKLDVQLEDMLFQ